MVKRFPGKTKEQISRAWHLSHECPDELVDVAEVKEHLLTTRSVSAEEEERFFKPSYDEAIHDPFLFAEMEDACNRIWKARDKRERILIYGDYDADGITSTALLASVLRDVGCRVTPFLPHRDDHGYGLNSAVLREMADGLSLIITVDCGISNAAEIAELKQRGIDVIVIDHHQLPDELPETTATIHPVLHGSSYPFPDLCGAGVAWKVATALLRDKRARNRDQDAEKWLLDLAALGTIADIVPLRGENRAIVQFGLQVLQRTKRAGLTALLQALKINSGDITTDTLAFQVIPRINAAGRLEHPQPALDLLMAATVREAQVHVAALEVLNRRRQTVTQRVVKEAEAQLALQDDAPVIVVHDANWPVGVMGLVASRLSKQHDKPAFVIGGSGENAVGSCRSPNDVNLVELLQTQAEILSKFGGHAQAAGFSLQEQDVSEFALGLKKASSDDAASTQVRVEADAYVAPQVLGRALFDAVEQFAPFGKGNERPSFLARGIPVVESRTVGKGAEHVKLTLHIADETRDAIGFGMADRTQNVKPGTNVDVVGELTENVWRGRRSLELSLTDVAPAGAVPIVM